jgi:hypothetical protein
LVLGGPIFWRLDEGKAVFQFLRDFAPEVPDELGIAFAASLAPPSPILPREQYGKPVLALVVVWSGDPAEGEQVIAPLRAIGTPIGELVRQIPYVALQSMLDGGAPHGRHYYWKAHRLPRLSDQVIDTLLARVAAITSPFSQIGGWAVGGAVSRIDPTATAVAERDFGFDVNIAAGRRRTSTASATWPGCAKGGRSCAHTRRASTPTSSLTRVPRASRPPMAIACSG